MRSATPLLEGCRPEGKAGGRPGQAPGWVRGGGTGRAPEDRLDPWRRRPPRWGMRDGGGVGVGGRSIGSQHRLVVDDNHCRQPNHVLTLNASADSLVVNRFFCWTTPTIRLLSYLTSLESALKIGSED